MPDGKRISDIGLQLGEAIATELEMREWSDSKFGPSPVGSRGPIEVQFIDKGITYFCVVTPGQDN